MKIVLFLSLLSQLKIFHWQTTSYAQHKALGKTYENLDRLFDLFVETYYGKYGKPNQQKVYTIELESVKDIDVKKFIGNKKRELISHLRNDVATADDGDLRNIIDEIEGEFNHLQYLLDLS